MKNKTLSFFTYSQDQVVYFPENSPLCTDDTEAFAQVLAPRSHSIKAVIVRNSLWRTPGLATGLCTLQPILFSAIYWELRNISLVRLQPEQRLDLFRMLGSLPEIQYLDLSDNDLTLLADEELVTLFMELAKLPNLTHIDLDDNNITTCQQKSIENTFAHRNRKIAINWYNVGSKSTARQAVERGYWTVKLPDPATPSCSYWPEAKEPHLRSIWRAKQSINPAAMETALTAIYDVTPSFFEEMVTRKFILRSILTTDPSDAALVKQFLQLGQQGKQSLFNLAWNALEDEVKREMMQDFDLAPLCQLAIKDEIRLHLLREMKLITAIDKDLENYGADQVYNTLEQLLTDNRGKFGPYIAALLVHHSTRGGLSDTRLAWGKRLMRLSLNYNLLDKTLASKHAIKIPQPDGTAIIGGSIRVLAAHNNFDYEQLSNWLDEARSDYAATLLPMNATELETAITLMNNDALSVFIAQVPESRLHHPALMARIRLIADGSLMQSLFLRVTDKESYFKAMGVGSSLETRLTVLLSQPSMVPFKHFLMTDHPEFVAKFKDEIQFALETCDLEAMTACVELYGAEVVESYLRSNIKAGTAISNSAHDLLENETCASILKIILSNLDIAPADRLIATLQMLTDVAFRVNLNNTHLTRRFCTGQLSRYWTYTLGRYLKETELGDRLLKTFETSFIEDIEKMGQEELMKFVNQSDSVFELGHPRLFTRILEVGNGALLFTCFKRYRHIAGRHSCYERVEGRTFLARLLDEDVPAEFIHALIPLFKTASCLYSIAAYDDLIDQSALSAKFNKETCVQIIIDFLSEQTTDTNFIEATFAKFTGGDGPSTLFIELIKSCILHAAVIDINLFAESAAEDQAQPLLMLQLQLPQLTLIEGSNHHSEGIETYIDDRISRFKQQLQQPAQAEYRGNEKKILDNIRCIKEEILTCIVDAITRLGLQLQQPTFYQLDQRSDILKNFSNHLQMANTRAFYFSFLTVDEIKKADSTIAGFLEAKQALCFDHFMEYFRKKYSKVQSKEKQPTDPEWVRYCERLDRFVEIRNLIKTIHGENPEPVQFEHALASKLAAIKPLSVNTFLRWKVSNDEFNGYVTALEGIPAYMLLTRLGEAEQNIHRLAAETGLHPFSMLAKKLNQPASMSSSSSASLSASFLTNAPSSGAASPTPYLPSGLSPQQLALMSPNNADSFAYSEFPFSPDGPN